MPRTFLLYGWGEAGDQLRVLARESEVAAGDARIVDRLAERFQRF